MNTNPGDHWRNQGGLPSGDGQSQGRTFGGYGPNPASQQSHVLPPPPTSNYPLHHSQQQQPPSQPQSGHSLSIADLTQGHPPHSQYNTQPPPPTHSQSHSINSISGPLPHQSPDYLSRDRDMRDLRAREEQRERERSLMQEREARERQLDRLSKDHQQPPLQSHAGSLPIHQPVASKVQGTLQGPNGLLGNGGVMANPPQNSVFGEPQRQGPYSQHPTGQQQGFLGRPSPMSVKEQLAHVAATGQQPILNDALSYLDQVKMRFSDQPDVYNRFLDIMKDFKSQAIDTPGVIKRVSELFNGHPALIQGFNTFLPPGYRIECGTEENPDAIRVTTPSGTTTQSMQTRGNRGSFDTVPPMSGQMGLARQDTVESARSWGHQVSPAARPVRLPGFDQSAQPSERYDQEAAIQQDQRNVSHLQNAANAAANGQTRPGQGSSPGPGQQSIFSQPGGLFGNGGDVKRGGPVEFNHAISYVNKIKNRFAQQPEIYKQFLEILQTYQRESKPIQDVYSQVTQLFHEADDLLEDFKQFLPESTAQAKASAAAARAQQSDVQMSGVRNEAGYSAPLPQTQTPRPTAKMPPMGQFDPPSTSKDSKKRKAPGAALPQTLSQSAAEPKSRPPESQSMNKRQKFDAKPKTTDVPMVPPVDPTLVPALPEPLPPAPSVFTSQDELGFFDRAKKQIGNRSSYAEFLKLINLYTNDIIDKYTLADRVQSFIGSNPDLMSFFRGLIGLEDHDEVVEARIRQDTGRVNLAHCRAFGPSYRHLPKRDQNKPCKGRDGMCYEVLNDVWASHPTWASEDSGFVAHRKNQYEEALHRIEEERHDYDSHIECCQRTIQLMEPLVQQIGVLSEQDRANFQVDKGLGGPSEAIPKRIILKIYGRELGNKVLEDMFTRPAQVMPLVLQRLKQTIEQWKQVQREWEKIWRDQISKQFWKSLDHQGIAQKSADKKNFQTKTLTNEIQAKYEEQKKSRDAGIRGKKHQLEYKFDDVDLLKDTIVLILVQSDHGKYDGDAQIRTKVKAWLQDFVVKFFGLEKDDFLEKVEFMVQSIASASADQEFDDADSDAQSTAKRSRPLTKSDLRKSAMLGRNNKEDSVAPTSKESTPAPEAMSTTSMEQDSSAPEEAAVPKKWISITQVEHPTRELSMDEPFERESFNFYANVNLYCFFRLFEMLYSRLAGVKAGEDTVIEAVRRFKGDGMNQKPALALRMIDRTPKDFFTHLNGERSFYRQVLEMCSEVLLGTTDRDHLEETLRRYYNKTGWQLYTVDKLVPAIVKIVQTFVASDSKEKSLEIANLFLKDREKHETTRKIELQYRQEVAKRVRDTEMYRITWHQTEKTCTIRLFPSDAATYDGDELSEEARWQYYVAAYTMFDTTEGIDVSRVRRAFLSRNIPAQSADPRVSYSEGIGNLDYVDDQTAKIDLGYKLHLEKVFGFARRKVLPGKQYKMTEMGEREEDGATWMIKKPIMEESEPFREKFVRNVAWMKDQRTEDVEARKAAWDKGVREGLTDFEGQFSD